MIPSKKNQDGLHKKLGKIGQFGQVVGSVYRVIIYGRVSHGPKKVHEFDWLKIDIDRGLDLSNLTCI